MHFILKYGFISMVIYGNLIFDYLTGSVLFNQLTCTLCLHVSGFGSNESLRQDQSFLNIHDREEWATL